MSEPAALLAAAAQQHLARTWDSSRAQRVESSLRARAHRRARARRALLAGAPALLLLCALGVLRVLRAPRQGGGVVLPVPPPGALRTSDGSVATVETPDTALELAEDSPQRATLRLRHGAALFEVVHRPGRVFRVEAGPTAVQVLGTVFRVERLSNETRVAVREGRVRVFWAGRSVDLGVGESERFADAEPVAATPAAPVAPTAEEPSTPAEEAVRPVAPAPRRAARASAPSAEPARPDWRALAANGEFEAAARCLAAGCAQDLRSNPEDLLLAADAARFGGNPEQAATLLRRLTTGHASDPRAPLAAFTLGRVLLGQLGRPAEAAAAFAQAQRLGPANSLAEDALAREVEALSRAGDAAGAHSAAQRYAQRYPEGRWLRVVRAFGALP